MISFLNYEAASGVSGRQAHTCTLGRKFCVALLETEQNPTQSHASATTIAAVLSIAGYLAPYALAEAGLKIGVTCCHLISCRSVCIYSIADGPEFVKKKKAGPSQGPAILAMSAIVAVLLPTRRQLQSRGRAHAQYL